MPHFSGNSIYLAKDFPLSELINYAAFKIDIFHQVGIVIYINGNEIYRKYLEGEIYFDLLATGNYEKPTKLSLIIPSMYLSDNNKLRIELHKYIDYTKPLFSIYSIPILTPSEGCIMTSTIYGHVSSSSNNSYKQMVPSNALDLSSKTIWYELKYKDYQPVKPYIEISFGENTYAWVNQLSITSNKELLFSDNYYYPHKIKYQGSNLQTDEWEEILTVEDSIQLSGGPKFLFYLFYNNKLYNKIKISFEEMVNPLADLKVEDLYLASCHKYYCDGVDGYPTTPAGKRAGVPCEVGYVGTVYRTCSLGRNPTFSIDDRSDCDTIYPTELKYPNSQYSLITYMIIPNMKPTYSFKGPLEFSIEPEELLPKGLLFSQTTGEITGRPIVRIDNTSFEVTAMDPVSNMSDSTSFYLYISVRNCTKDGIWEEVEAGETLTEDCPKEYLGMMNRTCVDGPMPEWAAPNLDGCEIITIPTTTTEETTTVEPPIPEKSVSAGFVVLYLFIGIVVAAVVVLLLLMTVPKLYRKYERMSRPKQRERKMRSFYKSQKRLTECTSAALAVPSLRI